MPDTGHAIDPDQANALLRACHTRRLDREGIPMVLALVDERHETVPSSNDRTRADGTTLADLLGAYADILVPPPIFRPDDEGALITAMQVLAYAHFSGSAEPDPGLGATELTR